jgi:hypothetical protein
MIAGVPLHIAEYEFERRPNIRLRKSYAKGIPRSSMKLCVQRIVSAWRAEAKALVPRTPAVNHYEVWLSKSKWFPEFVEGSAEYYLMGRSGLLHYRGCGSFAKPQGSVEAEKIVNRILSAVVDSDLRDEDEPAPSIKVAKKAIYLIRGAEKLLGKVPQAQVSTFYGEINISWRSGDKIVRLACFPDRPSVIQVGLLSLPIGSYRSEENPTAMLLAARLGSFVR